MPTDNLIIAEFDKWRMNLGQAPCLSGRRPTGSDKTMASDGIKKNECGGVPGCNQDVNFLHCSDNVELLEVRIRLLRPASRLNDD